jgi:hypothetical protein
MEDETNESYSSACKVDSIWGRREKSISARWKGGKIKEVERTLWSSPSSRGLITLFNFHSLVRDLGAFHLSPDIWVKFIIFFAY